MGGRIPHSLRKQPRSPKPGGGRLGHHSPPLSTQLEQPLNWGGLKGPRAPRCPRDFRAFGSHVSPDTRQAQPGSWPAGAGLGGRAGGGAEAGAQPGAAPGGGTGRSGSPERDRGGGSQATRTAAGAACSTCPRPGNRSLQLTPPAAGGFGLPSRREPAAAQVGATRAERGGERGWRGAGRGSWAEAGRGSGCWSLRFLARGPWWISSGAAGVRASGVPSLPGIPQSCGCQRHRVLLSCCPHRRP